MKNGFSSHLHTRLWIFLLPFLLSYGCAGLVLQSKPAPVPQVRPGILAGYLQMSEWPDSLVLLPPPPAAGSAAFALDEEISRKCEALSGSPRWTQAALDANLDFPEAAQTYSCALGIPVSEKDTPYLYQLLRRSFTDAIVATLKAKGHYKRIRPFMLHNTSMCTPSWEEQLRKDGSYPSGHSAIGWTWALILSELAPERGDAILARGRAFGESRLVCNVHWQSDVIEGRFMASAVVSRLHANPAFLTDMKAAKAEIAAQRTRGATPVRSCTEETAALSGKAVQEP